MSETDKNVSEQIEKRMLEEKRKAELKQEQKMAKARQEANEKKLQRQSEQPEIVKETPIEAPKQEVDKEAVKVDDGEKYVTKEKMRQIIEEFNKSFKLVEEQFHKQQEQLDTLNGLFNTQKDYFKKLL